MRPTLRLFTEDDSAAGHVPLVTMSLGEFCQILGDAKDTDRTWIQDFADDEIQVPVDLYEVLHAYAHMRAAA
ncbi:MAG: hypothetical protein KDA86_01225 [Planctomycetaceae bacterium]|nr:hypothetical protein [Planctomycetaceae bacterium]MCA9109105.1 hypothetical protein [Planctomycetaceae bacterium]